MCILVHFCVVVRSFSNNLDSEVRYFVAESSEACPTVDYSLFFLISFIIC